MKIMFVCHGNICRSPMAEFIMKDLLQREGITNVTVASCATSTEEIINGVGNPVYPPAKAELARHGLSCEGKRAVQLKAADYGKWDLFVAMDDYNIRNIARILKDPQGKVRKLNAKDVSDPWWSGDFQTAFREIEEGCKRLLKEIKGE